MNQPTLQPTDKMAATGIGGALAIVLVFVARQFNLDVPAEVASAFTVIVAWLSGYMKKEG